MGLLSLSWRRFWHDHDNLLSAVLRFFHPLPVHLSLSLPPPVRHTLLAFCFPCPAISMGLVVFIAGWSLLYSYGAFVWCKKGRLLLQHWGMLFSPSCVSKMSSAKWELDDEDLDTLVAWITFAKKKKKVCLITLCFPSKFLQILWSLIIASDLPVAEIW